ncbi:MAG: tRNA (adenosine(37)-N6)-threonylcarbamoyltransferase complex dimerization subunit type 1 TsaB, partial [Gammaproteobacteria bacterium]
PPNADHWFGAGSGFAAYGETLITQLNSVLDSQDATLLPCARDIAALAVRLFTQGHAVSADQALPVYLRDRVAWPKPGL